jgi:hypothetical protein
LRKDQEEPPGPQPGDYLRRITTWLEDERTKAPFPLPGAFTRLKTWLEDESPKVTATSREGRQGHGLMG